MQNTQSLAYSALELKFNNLREMSGIFNVLLRCWVLLRLFAGDNRGYLNLQLDNSLSQLFFATFITYNCHTR